MPRQPRPHPHPESPGLRDLREQVKQRLRSGGAKSLPHAQRQVARHYDFPAWSKLKAHTAFLEETASLKQAIDSNHRERVQLLLSRNPALHCAPLGYGKNGPLTWAA